MVENDELRDWLDNSNLAEYIPVVYARDDEQAEQYKDILTDHDIIAIIGVDEHGEGISKTDGIPVLVPRDMANEAEEVIEKYEEMDGIVVNSDEFEDKDENDDDEDVSLVPLDADDLFLEEEDEDDTDCGFGEAEED
ncbi:MAG: hypothetical protein HQ546_04665 [Planctomycetes bacterium]|nr:hypothetical protein [Planctomycetota bacterium]